jgi:hypothetical protein
MLAAALDVLPLWLFAFVFAVGPGDSGSSCSSLEPDGRLRWWAALRSGSIDVTQLLRARGSRFAPGMFFLEHTGGTLRVHGMQPGFEQVLSALRRARPDLVVALGSFQGRALALVRVLEREFRGPAGRAG